MSRSRFRPPLNKRFVAAREGYDIFTIDPFAIRNHAQPDEEFDNFATHQDFPDLIDKREIWLAAATFRSEGRFFLSNAIAQLKAAEEGASESAAYEAGLRTERELRQQATGLKYRDGKPHRRTPSAIYRRRFCTLPDREGPVEVWRVDGSLVRSYYKTDYTEGGHWQVYPWIPRGQIWVEWSLSAAELPFIISHEYIEMRLMREQKLEYDRAHEICAEMEFDLRRAETRKLFPGLHRRGFSKEQLDAITDDEFFDYVNKQYVKNWSRRIRAFVSDVASKIIP